MSIPIVDEDAERLRRRIQERASTLLSGPTRCDQAVLLLALSDRLRGSTATSAAPRGSWPRSTHRARRGGVTANDGLRPRPQS